MVALIDWLCFLPMVSSVFPLKTTFITLFLCVLLEASLLFCLISLSTLSPLQQTALLEVASHYSSILFSTRASVRS